MDILVFGRMTNREHDGKVDRLVIDGCRTPHRSFAQCVDDDGALHLADCFRLGGIECHVARFVDDDSYHAILQIVTLSLVKILMLLAIQVELTVVLLVEPSAKIGN